jgi:hypothetical protein
MVNFEAEMNSQPYSPGPVSGFASGAANVLGDLLELAELQAKLAKADASRAMSSAMPPAFTLVIGGCTALAALPVVILGLATLLADMSPLNAWQAQLLVGVLVASMAAAIVYISLRKLRRASSQFQRSLQELENNVAWAKSAVRSHQRQPAPPTGPPQRGPSM